MKTKFLFPGFIAMSLITNAQQWNGPSTTSGDIYRDGNVGIGNTVTDPAVKLDIVHDANPFGGSQWGVRSHITQISPLNGGAFWPYVGVQGRAETNYPGESYMYGFTGTGYNGQMNWGAKFTGMGANDLCLANYGVQASAWGNGYSCYGIWAEAGGCYNANWAGYFNGDVYRSGTDNFTSDRKLKNNIQPLTGSLEKLMKLKPSSYTFKRDEYMNMHLPKGKQMGLIAQDLEEVFPELVTNMPEVEMPDKDGKMVLMNPEFKSVQYISLIPVLIGGIQEQQKHINLQDEEIANLKNEIAELKKAGSTTGVGQLNTVETGFRMLQNEPNPFTHETLVKYTLPQATNSAFMAVYDLTGKQITTFPIEQKGSASISITSEKLAAGIYLYSIVADGKVMDTKRMIVAEK